MLSTPGTVSSAYPGRASGVARGSSRSDSTSGAEAGVFGGGSGGPGRRARPHASRPASSLARPGGPPTPPAAPARRRVGPSTCGRAAIQSPWRPLVGGNEGLSRSPIVANSPPNSWCEPHQSGLSAQGALPFQESFGDVGHKTPQQYFLLSQRSSPASAKIRDHGKSLALLNLTHALPPSVISWVRAGFCRRSPRPTKYTQEDG